MALLWQVVSLAFLVTTGLSMPSLAMASCPSGFVANVHHNSCIKLGPRGKTWPDAREECASWGSHLVSIDSLDMVKFMCDVFNGRSDTTVWTAYNDIWTSGQFRSSVDGSRMNYSNWCKYDCSHPQPNDPAHDQNCVVQNVQKIKCLPKETWQDTPCLVADSARGVACEQWTGGRSTKHFRNYPVTSPQEVKLRQLYEVTQPTSKPQCSVICLRHLLCDAFTFAHDDTAEGQRKGVCRLFTLREDNPDFASSVGMNVSTYTVYVMEI